MIFWDPKCAMIPCPMILKFDNISFWTWIHISMSFDALLLMETWEYFWQVVLILKVIISSIKKYQFEKLTILSCKYNLSWSWHHQNFPSKWLLLCITWIWELWMLKSRSLHWLRSRKLRKMFEVVFLVLVIWIDLLQKLRHKVWYLLYQWQLRATRWEKMI